MEAIITVELRFAYGHKYTSWYRGKEVTVKPAFGAPHWYLGMTDASGVRTTLMNPCNDDDIVRALKKNGYNSLLMRWCMEESKDHGFNPFVDDVTRLKDYPQHVYIMHDLNDDLIKVGTTQDYKSRIRSLCAAKGHTFEMLGLMQGGLVIERMVCKQFNEYLVWGREWFRPCQEILDFVQEYTFHPGEPVKP